MPRIEPIPMDQLADEPRRIIEEGVADGTYATPVPLQIFAYRTAQIIQTNMARQAWGQHSLLGGRILELIRIRSAQLGECQPCMQSRKHDSITDEDVACLVSPGASGLTDQEQLGEVFTAAQIIELGFTCAVSMGTHRFIHTLDPFGTAPPVITFDPGQVDAAYPDTADVHAGG